MARLPGFNLELADSPEGPLLSLGDPDCRGLCRLVNAAVTGELPELTARLRRDETLELDGVRCGRPPASFDAARSREQFLARTGVDPDEQGGFVLVDGEPYPIYTLDDLANALQAQRLEWSRLKKRDSELRIHQERAAEITPAPWSARALNALEVQARILEDLEGDPASHSSVEAAAKVSVRRRFLLIELYGHGVLGPEEGARKWADLQKWELPLLQGWMRAALEHTQYQRCPERAEMAPGEPIHPILFSPISLDWFRKPTRTPAQVVVNRLQWTAWCEREAVRNFEGENRGDGWWIWHSGQVTHTFYWRFDNGETPALYKVT